MGWRDIATLCEMVLVPTGFLIVGWLAILMGADALTALVLTGISPLLIFFAFSILGVRR